MFVYPSAEKIYRKIWAILYNWKTANLIEAGFSLNIRAKQSENKFDWHHAYSYYRFRYIQL